MEILVAGATGMVGSEAAKIAVQNAHSVRALVRKTSRREKLGDFQNSISFFEGDMLDRDSLAPAMEGVEGLLIAIRFNQNEKDRGRTFAQVELDGLRNLVAAAQQTAVRKIVFITVAGAHAQCVSGMFQAKYQAEESVANSGLDYTILKPSGMFFDFRDFHIPMVLKLGQTDTWPTGPIDNRMSPLSHVDLARCMVDSLTNPKAQNIRLPIGGPETITTADLLNLIAREAGIKTTYTKGVSKEALIERVKANPEKSFFSAEEIQDFINDSPIEHQPVLDIFGFDFQKVGDYLKKTVPEVKAALAAQQQQC